MKFKLYHLLVLLGTALLLALSSKTSSVAARNRDMLYDLSSIEPLDEKVTKAIQKWQTYKFGLFFHWGIYSQLSDLIDIKAHDLASWPLEWSDRGRNNLNITTHEEMTAFRKFYWGLSKTFNPDKFDPNVWAEAAWRAGMRYVVMTTKHHDGFSMYNTTLDSYSVMGRDCPFQRDAFGEVMTAFKKKGFGTGAYYSKVDWHREDFWEPSTFAASRYTNYAPNEKESTWDSFVRFSQNQIVEIMKLYRPDILWFDGGWLNPPMYDMNFADISHLTRDIKDDVIIVNRGGGMFEDYMTPEQGGVPRAPYEKPWEICVTMATQWGYSKNDVYKSMPSLIELLLSVVSTGGNLLLDVGPDPHGQLPKDAMNRLQEFAKWMEYNGEGIHNSEPMYPYKFQSTMSEKLSHQFYLTKRNRDVYSFMMMREKMDPPRKIYMAFVTPTMLGDMPFKLKTVELLSVDEPLPFHFEADSLVVEIPKNLNLGYNYTMTFKLSEH